MLIYLNSYISLLIDYTFLNDVIFFIKLVIFLIIYAQCFFKDVILFIKLVIFFIKTVVKDFT
jgi:hypothetical protein